MESPLNAREFLKRFHLPQLVRLSGAPMDEEEEEEASEENDNIGNNCETAATNPSNMRETLGTDFQRNQSPEKARIKNPEQDIQQHSFNASLGAGRKPRQELQSHWTYKPAEPAGDNEHEFRGFEAHGCSNQVAAAVKNSSSSGGGDFRSLFLLPNEHYNEANETRESGFHSISAWSSAQVDEILQQQQQIMKKQREQNQHQSQQANGDSFMRAIVRVPRASLTSSQQQLPLKRSAQQNSSAFDKQASRERQTNFGSNATGSDRHGQAPDANSNNACKQDALESIRLTPPSCRPTLSKLQLNQPFLLYKAYKKLELCAYVLDPKNELNGEKSGDPIYFPQNYPGWFAISSGQQHNYHPDQQQQQHLQPLQSIQQVSQTGWQFFLTRDEFIAYRLPKALSKQTKLDNNQLLALPLPVTFEVVGRQKLLAAADNDKSNIRRHLPGKKGTHQAEKQQSKHGGHKKNTNDLGQVVIKCGQVLEICGLYDNLMTRIEGGGKQQLHEITKLSVAGRIPVVAAAAAAASAAAAAAASNDQPSFPPHQHHNYNYPQQQQQQQQLQSLVSQVSISGFPHAHHHPQMALHSTYHHPSNQQQQLYCLPNGYQMQSVPPLTGNVSVNQAIAAHQLLLHQRQQQQKQKQILVKQENTISFHEQPLSMSMQQQQQQRHSCGNFIAGQPAVCGLCQMAAPPLIYRPPEVSVTNGQRVQNLMAARQQQQQLPLPAVITIAPAQQQVKTNGGASGNSQKAGQGQQWVAGKSSQKQQMFARCRVLNQYSLDRLTSANCGSLEGNTIGGDHCDQACPGESEQIEVLIPLEQCGRFYLCATNQLLNQLSYSPPNSGKNAGIRNPLINKSNFVFRLNQIVLMLSVSKNMTQSQSQMPPSAPFNNNYRHHNQHQVFESPSFKPISLPLTVQLVIGPRPANFSPSMFGPSSTMKSYFHNEQNIGGHSIACKHNKSFTTATDEQSGTVDKENNNKSSSAMPSVGGPACFCAFSKASTAGATAASTNGQQEVTKGESLDGAFSALLRIERIQKRDVLLACTIKKDPLVHLDLFGDDGGSSNPVILGVNSNKSDKKSNSNNKIGFTLGPARLSSSSRLFKLSESSNLHQQIQQQRQEDADQQTAKTMGKLSSFSRLRACRSLINLNARKKRRPKIPSCMLPGGISGNISGLPGSFEDAPVGGANAAFNQPDTNLHQKIINSATSNPASIVIVEFDCNVKELLFVRTFVESSIPTSTIPDLVLNRMEFCQRNSYDWERQLKLSYRALSQDFISCQRQLNRNQIKMQLASQIRLQFDSSIVHHQAEIKQMATIQKTRENEITTTTKASNSIDSSASSSRSSSGVSSSGGERKNNKRIGGTATVNNAANNCSESGHAGVNEISIMSGARDSAITSDKFLLARALPAIINSATTTGGTPSALNASSPRKEHQVVLSSTTCADENAAPASNAGGRGLRRLISKFLPSKFAPATANSSSNSSSSDGFASRSSLAMDFVATNNAENNSASLTNVVMGEQQRKIIDELNGRFKVRNLKKVGTAGGGGYTGSLDTKSLLLAADHKEDINVVHNQSSSLEHQAATLMNAQKIHKKLMSLSERHLSALVLASESALETAGGRSRLSADRSKSPSSSRLSSFGDEETTTRRRGSERQISSEEEDSYSDTGSHLYESLEKIGEQLRRRRCNESDLAGQTDDAEDDDDNSKCNKQKCRKQKKKVGADERERQSRLAIASKSIGRSIEQLAGEVSVGDRRRALVGRSLPPERNVNDDHHLDHLESEQEFEKGEDDEWWWCRRRNQHNHRQQQRTRTSRSTSVAMAAIGLPSLPPRPYESTFSNCGSSGNSQFVFQQQTIRASQKELSDFGTTKTATAESGRLRGASFDNCSPEPLGIEACTEVSVSSTTVGRKAKQQRQQQQEQRRRAGSIAPAANCGQQQQRRPTFIDKKKAGIEHGDDCSSEEGAHDKDSMIYMNLAECRREAESSASSSSVREKQLLELSASVAVSGETKAETATEKGTGTGTKLEFTGPNATCASWSCKSDDSDTRCFVSRMDRKLMKMRGRRYPIEQATSGGSNNSANSNKNGCYHNNSYIDAHFLYDTRDSDIFSCNDDEDGDCEQEFRSINLPAVGRDYTRSQHRFYQQKRRSSQQQRWQPIMVPSNNGRKHGESRKVESSASSSSPVSLSSLVSIEQQLQPVPNAESRPKQQQQRQMVNSTRDGATGEPKLSQIAQQQLQHQQGQHQQLQHRRLASLCDSFAFNVVDDADDLDDEFDNLELVNLDFEDVNGDIKKFNQQHLSDDELRVETSSPVQRRQPGRKSASSQLSLEYNSSSSSSSSGGGASFERIGGEEGSNAIRAGAGAGAGAGKRVVPFEPKRVGQVTGSASKQQQQQQQ